HGEVWVRKVCARPRSHRGGAPTTKPNPTPNRRSTRPGCEYVPDPFAPRRCSYSKTTTQPRTVGAPAPGANGGPAGDVVCARPVRTEAVLLQQNQTQPRTVGAP